MYRIIFIIVSALCFAAAPGRAPDAAASETAIGIRDVTDAEAEAFMELIFDRRPHAGLALLDSLHDECTGRPLYQILRGRAYQEFVPMDDYNTDYGRTVSEPALQALDVAIEYCSARIDADDADPKLYFYRGWAWLAKSYVRSMTRNLFTAGREAGRGKKDMEKYLETHPNDPTANGMLGAFLYFADTIPSAFKFLSKLLFLPTGDRERGLAMLRNAIEGDGLMQTDWKVIFYNVYFYFEGRYEEGLDGLNKMVALHPAYIRTSIPLAVSRPFAPTLARENDRQLEAAVRSTYSGDHREVDWNALYIARVFRAYGDRFYNHSRLAESRFKAIVHEAPVRPDWVQSFARLELGCLYASQGRADDARAMWLSIINGFPFHHKEAKELLDDLEDHADRLQPKATRPTDGWIARIYRSGADSLSVYADRFGQLAPTSLTATFYKAECHLMLGEYDTAIPLYDRVVEADAPAWDECYQMVAATRIAEIYASLERYKRAVEYQDKAAKHYRDEYLIDWVLEGRKRYFDRLANGTELIRPTLLTINR